MNNRRRRNLTVALVVAATSFCSVGISRAQDVLSAFPGEILATPEGRLQIGRGLDYQPSLIDPQILFEVLERSMHERRAFGWRVAEQMLRPVKIKLLDGVTEVDVPMWQTWFEGQSSASDAPSNDEWSPIFKTFFRLLKPVLEANPDADVLPVIDATMKEYATKDLSASITDENLSTVLNQHIDSGPAGELLGQGFTLFSPSFVEHVMLAARGIDECRFDVATADRDPPSPDQFSHCIKEFPRSAVMVKTSWTQLKDGVAQHSTDAASMATVLKEGTWREGQIAHPDRTQIYTNISTQGTEWALTGIHFVTKDVREWVWVSLWWDPDASKDFGADRPETIATFNNGVWKNYKMCVVSAFEEKDAQPWRKFTGDEDSLGGSIKAVYDAINDQVMNGATNALGVPDSELLPGNLGPWPAPYNVPTTWCSNPNIETHAGNARTSCIGCHQIVMTKNERRNRQAVFRDATRGDLPQFGRALARKNFTGEFAWAFQFELGGTGNAIATGKEAAQFEWPN